MIEYQEQKYRELRCEECRALLGLEYILLGRLSIKCSRCKHTNLFNFKSSKQLVKTDKAKEEKGKKQNG